MNKDRYIRFFDITFFVLILILLIGTPLLFTTLTRSVFEVGKLLLLRLILIAVYTLWIGRYFLFKDNKIELEKENNLILFKIPWRLSLEWILFAWLGVNVLATIFSQNIFLGIIGSYDRWEGIITVLNYVMLIFMFAKLIRKRYQFHPLVIGIVISTGLSAIYGIFQSFGWDFINWSMDPQFRVFASINNPVHFCAYVAMGLPLGMSMFYVFLSEKLQFQNFFPNLKKYFILGLFILIVCIFFSQFLSYSRATWFGFMLAMPIFYLLATSSFNQTSFLKFISEVIILLIFLLSFYLLHLFKIQHIFPWSYKIILPILCLTLLCNFIFSFNRNSVKHILIQGIIEILFLWLVFSAFIQPFSSWVLMFILFGLFAVIWFNRYIVNSRNSYLFFYKILICTAFVQLNIVTLSLKTAFFYAILMALLWLTHHQLNRNKQVLKTKISKWSLLFLIVFGVTLFTPSIPKHIESIFGVQMNQIKSLFLSEHRMTTYTNKTRLSMWKSSIPWIKDHWLIGTGQDTIKYMYPTYRDPKYGIYEGGHNFTPDRLHNDYINMMATIGVPGFILFYIFFCFSWFILMLYGIYRSKNNPYHYYLIAFVTGFIIYSIQTIFNFGVVATKILFFSYLGLGLALCFHKTFIKELK